MLIIYLGCDRHIMLAFCAMLLHSYYAKNFGMINADLPSGVAPVLWLHN